MTTPLLSAFVGAPTVNKVYCMDALTLLKHMPTGSVDLVVTSPPYDNLRTYNGYSWDFEAIARETYRVLKTGGVLVWVVGDATVNGQETLTSMRQALYFVDQCGFWMNDTMIYHRQGRFPELFRYWQDFEYMFVLVKGKPKTFNALKERAKYGGKKVSTERQQDGSLQRPKTIRQTSDMKSLSNIWYVSRGDMSRDDELRYEHPAAFPETLAERHILTWSNPGDLVLDYFGGSGTTAKMARKNGRDYLTCDISPEYCDLMERRLSMPYTSSFMPALDAQAEATA
jgi:DNA modification methylase